MDLFNDLSGLFQMKFGMDFGTYRSIVACKAENAEPRTPNYKDDNLGGVPSLFWRSTDGQEYVGDEVAKKGGKLVDPNGICSSVKTRLGAEKIVLNGYAYTPSDIAIKLTRRILEVSKKAFESDFVDMNFAELVVGVPVRFSAAEKGEIHRIMEIATGGAKIRLVPEPILAALANDFFTKKGGRVPRNVLVYDMGAGTFDVVLLKPNQNRTAQKPYPYEAVNPDGKRIAGDLLDGYMAELLLEKIRANPGNLKIAVLENKQHADYRRLLESAREIKERLSEDGVDSYPCMISGVECGFGMVVVTRSEFEAKIRPVIQETVDLAAEVLSKSGLGAKPDVDILLVGGSTYIPLIRQMLREKFDWIDDSHILQRLPEKAVAMGAAIYAEAPELVLPKVAYGYAVNTYHTSNRRSMLHVRIPSNADLPKTVTAYYDTRFDGQHDVMFYVYEVNSGAQDEYLELSQGKMMEDADGRYQIVHDFGKAVPRGTTVELTTTLDKDGMLTMRVDDLGVSNRRTEKLFNLTNSTPK